MKRKGMATQAGDGFVRGFVATALLAAVQADPAGPDAPLQRRRLMRLALQGGTALAAGAAVSHALQRRDWTGAAAALAGGAVGLTALEHLMSDKPLTETRDGQEERQEALEEGRLRQRRDDERRRQRPRAGHRAPARQ